MSLGASPVALAPVPGFFPLYQTARLRKGPGGACRDDLEGLTNDAI